MTNTDIIEGSKLIANYLGWQYVPFNDLGDFPKPGWWIVYPKSQDVRINIFRASPKSNLSKIGDGFGKFICRHHSELRFYNDWNEIIKVIEKLQKEDLSHRHYSWEQGGETRNNFMGLEFTLYHNGAYSDIELQLDPPIEVSKSFDDSLTWIQNTWNVVVKTIKYINNERN